MPTNGDLREKVHFESPTSVADGYGNTVQGWTRRFSRRALYIMRPGSEAVQAARLAGRQPVTVIVRFDGQTSAVTPAWRLVDARTGVVMKILAADDMDRRRRWWSMTCEMQVT